MYVGAVDEAGGDVVEDPTEEKVVIADEVPTVDTVVRADELGFEDVAEGNDEDVEDAAVVDDTIFELRTDETPD